MKKKLKKMAILGLATGLCALTGGNLSAAELKEQLGDELYYQLLAANTSDKSKATDESISKKNSENEGYKLMTEDEILGELNAKGRSLFESLTPEGKALALKVASQRCDGTNDCKGLNSCKTDTNDCAGKGSCRGTTKCAIGDKNLAVKLAAKKMADKRQNLPR